MSDPFSPEKGLSEAKEIASKITSTGSIYQGHNLSQIHPPKVIFILTKKILRKMIKALVLFGGEESNDVFFMRFGLLENNH